MIFNWSVLFFWDFHSDKIELNTYLIYNAEKKGFMIDKALF